MLTEAALVVLRLGGWSYLPDIATRQLLSVYHRFILSRGATVPKSGTPRWQTHYRIAFALAVLGYLTYNLVEATRGTPPNFFQTLGVAPEADAIALKNAYRAFAKRYHPDRAGPASEPMFIAIRDAYEALKDPVKRFAYERFGPDALNWRDCSSPREFIWRGLMQSSGFYIVTGFILISMSVVAKPSPVAFWRYILFFGVLASELCLIVRNDSWVLGLIFPERVAFQHVFLLHQISIFLSFAVSRVAPVLFPEPPTIRPEDPRTYAPYLERLHRSLKFVDGEASRMLQLELHAMSGDTSNDISTFASVTSTGSVTPCNPPPDVLAALVHEMEDMLVEQQVRNELPLRALWDAAVQKEQTNEKGGHDPVASNDEEILSPEREVEENGSQASSSTLNARLFSPSTSMSSSAPSVELLGRPEARIRRRHDQISHEGSDDLSSPSLPPPALPPGQSMLRTSSSRSAIRVSIVERHRRVGPSEKN
ncbi:hypothetical protein M0805_009089 [Coniferiporia weirii]|nr:hypothetical protein M0805_009089 [Coniferiporia weirii]